MDIFNSIRLNDQAWADGIPVTEEWAIKNSHRNDMNSKETTEGKTDASVPTIPRATFLGIAVTKNGYVLALYEDLEGAKRVEVRCQGRTYPARAIAADKGKGLVILKVDGALSPIRFQNPNDFRTGIPVISIGCEKSEPPNVLVSHGAVSPSGIDAKGKFSFSAEGVGDIAGGPVVNEKGELVGIVESIESTDDVFSDTAGTANAICGANLIAFIRTCPDCLKSISNKDLPTTQSKEVAAEYAKRSTVLVVTY